MFGFKKNIIPLILMIVTVIIAVTFVFLLYLSIGYTTYLDTANISFDNTSKDFQFNVGTIKFNKDKKYLMIAGWIFKKEEDIRTVSSNYVLYDEQEGKYILLPSKMVVRNDVENHFKSKNKIKNSGINSLVNIKNLNSSHTYKLYVLYRNNNNNILVFMHKKINGLGEIIK